MQLPETKVYAIAFGRNSGTRQAPQVVEVVLVRLVCFPNDEAESRTHPKSNGWH